LHDVVGVLALEPFEQRRIAVHVVEVFEQALCWKCKASSSTPFMRMTITRVKASSSSLLIGFCTSSRGVWRAQRSAEVSTQEKIRAQCARR
jgi:hypothetical protein